MINLPEKPGRRERPVRDVWHRPPEQSPIEVRALGAMGTYGYDKADNRLWRDHLLVPGTSPQHDELYRYDGLYQVTRRQRGSLNTSHTAISGTPERQEPCRLAGGETDRADARPHRGDAPVRRVHHQHFTFDPLGNWDHYTLAIGGSTDTDHSREHNQSNQLTAISGTPSGLIAHDANGNLTKTVPDKDGDWTKGYRCTWDAWNRLVKVQTQETTPATVAAYQYDALFRRTLRTANGQTHHEYWDAAWRLLEERIHSATAPFTLLNSQIYLWGLQRRNDLILRDATTSLGEGSGSSSSSGSTEPTRHYVTYDWINPTTILSRTGTVLARQVFSAFGIRAIVAPDWSESFTVPSELADWNFGFHGQFTDSETGWANYGFRYYVSVLGKWLVRDLIWEMDGVNIYSYTRNAATRWTDTLGLLRLKVDHQRTVSGNFATYGTIKIYSDSAEDNRCCGLPLSFRTIEPPASRKTQRRLPDQASKGQVRKENSPGYKGGTSLRRLYKEVPPPPPEGVNQVDYYAGLDLEIQLKLGDGRNIHAGVTAESSAGCILIGEEYIPSSLPGNSELQPGTISPDKQTGFRYPVPGFDYSKSLNSYSKLATAIACLIRRGGINLRNDSEILNGLPLDYTRSNDSKTVDATTYSSPVGISVPSSWDVYNNRWYPEDRPEDQVRNKYSGYGDGIVPMVPWLIRE